MQQPEQLRKWQESSNHGYLWETEMNINRMQSKYPTIAIVAGFTGRRYSPPMFGCFSCYHSASDRCLVHENGFPNIGSNCIAFDYDPGTDAEER